MYGAVGIILDNFGPFQKFGDPSGRVLQRSRARGVEFMRRVRGPGLGGPEDGDFASSSCSQRPCSTLGSPNNPFSMVRRVPLFRDVQSCQEDFKVQRRKGATGVPMIT